MNCLLTGWLNMLHEAGGHVIVASPEVLQAQPTLLLLVGGFRESLLL